MRTSSRSLRILVGTALAGLALAGVAGAQSSDVRAAIEAANKQFSAAVTRGDAAGIAALYSANAEVLPPGGDVAKGRAAIQKLMQGFIDAGAKELPLATVEVEAHGDTAWEVGTWTLKGKDGAELDHGKSVVIWKKEAGGWKLYRDIWNSSQAPAH